MSLEKFRRTRMVVLGHRSMAYQAARAMADNHIGAVLVSQPRRPPGIMGILTDRDLALAVLGGDLDPKTTPLGEVMSEEVVTCDIGAGIEEVARLMRQHGIRRIPLTEEGRPVGLVTFDDLVLEGSVDLEALRSIVVAQLEVEAPHKPAGMLHPQTPTSAEGRARALVRAKARAQATYDRMVKAVADRTGLDRERAARALFLATCMLCQRLTPDEAQHLVAQLPSLLQPQLDECLAGPDRAVTRGAIEGKIAKSLGLAPEKAAESARAVLEVVSESVSPGQIAEVRGQLPEDMKGLLPAAG